MKEEIQEMIDVLKSEEYDQEWAHQVYDNLLQRFILNYDESLLPLMRELILLEKNFWYA